MGFSNVTGKYRPKRGGCETATQRKKRRYRTGDQETAQDIRVVKKQKERAYRRPAMAQLPKQKSAAQKRLKALVKKNEDIKKLRRKQEAGAALDAQQTAKLAMGTRSCSSPRVLEQDPAEAAAYAAARDDTKAAIGVRPQLKFLRRRLDLHRTSFWVGSTGRSSRSAEPVKGRPAAREAVDRGVACVHSGQRRPGALSAGSRVDAGGRR